MARGVEISVRIEGADALAAAFEDLERRVARETMRKALEEAAEVVRAEASRLAPRRTGRLAENIVTAWEGGRAQAALIGPRAGKRSDPKSAFYGLFQELGTSRHPAQPFLRPAFEAKREEAVERAADVLRDEVEKTRARGV